MSKNSFRDILIKLRGANKDRDWRFTLSFENLTFEETLSFQERLDDFVGPMTVKRENPLADSLRAKLQEVAYNPTPTFLVTMPVDKGDKK